MTQHEVEFEPVPASEIKKAIRQHYQDNAGLHVMNSRLFIVLVVVGLGFMGSLGVIYKQTAVIKDIRPMIIRINGVGRAEPVAYKDFDYAPDAGDFKIALRSFVKLHNSRIKSTVLEDRAESLHFLDKPLQITTAQEDMRTDWMAKFVNGSNEEVKIAVNNIVITDMRKQPYSAMVDFERHYVSSQVETKKERWTATFKFFVHPSTESAQDYINPLGFAIVDYREDKALN